MFELQNIYVSYGSICAVNDISLTIMPGEITLIKGPFGAGKTSLLKAIVGAVQSSGTVRVFGDEIRQHTPYSMAKLGVSIMPEGQAIFPRLSVKDNLKIGASQPPNKQKIQEVVSVFPDLLPYLNEPAFKLSGGQRQMVAYARTLVSNPKILLLDEPLVGLSEKPVAAISSSIVKTARNGAGILMVEQNAGDLELIASRIFSMNFGQIKEEPCNVKSYQ